MSDKPLLRYNTFAELQQEICDIVNTAPELSACGVTFYPENALDIDYQITNSLKKQGIAAVVMTPDARYIGYEDRGCVYQLDNLTLMISEFPAVNRASNRSSVATGLDIANFCAEILAGPNAVVGFGKLNVKSIEQGEDSGLLVTKVTFQTVLSNGAIPPYIWVEYVTHEELSAAIDDLSATVDSRLSSTTPASRAKMLPDYLYELDFSDSYPEAAQEIYDEFDIGKCSAIREGNTFARNYDWLFSEAATFVVNRNKTGNVHSSVGVASVGSKITNADVKSGKWIKWYKALPGMTLDGINDAGVFGSVNVVAAKEPVGYSGTYCGFGAIRYVLDNFDNATDAAQWVAQNVYIPPKFLEQGYSLHYLIGDASTTWIVEDGVARPANQSRTVLTNYRLFNGSDAIHTDRADIATYDPYGTGLERYSLLSSEGVSAIFDARFTKAYDAGFPRPTEFVGATPALTLSSSDEDLRAWAASHVPYIRERGDGTWQSVHTSEYDIANRTLTLRVQEIDDPYVFVVPAYTKEDLVLAWGNLSGDLSAQTDLYNELTSIKSDISANAEGITAAFEAIGTVSTDLNTVSTDLISLSDIVKVHTTQVASLSSELSTQSARIDVVQQDISHLAGNFDVLSAKANALSARAEATDLAVAAVSADLSALSGQVQQNAADIDDILEDIDILSAKTTPVQPSTDAPLSALAGAKATADFVNSSINAFAAYYITKDAAGNPFATAAELQEATAFYNAGAVRVPTKNDYAIVVADEEHPIEHEESEPTYPSTRWIFQGTTYPDGQWEYQYTINNAPFTDAQWKAINSGIDDAHVQQINEHGTAIAQAQQDIEGLQESKADKSELDNYATTEALQEVQDQVDGLQESKADKDDLLDYALCADVDERLAHKADLTALEAYALCAEVNIALSAKADKADIRTLSAKDNALSAEISSVVTVVGNDGITYHNLSVEHLTYSEYAERIQLSTLAENEIYIVGEEEDYIDALGQQIKNVMPPTELSDVTTKEYVDSSVSAKADLTALAAKADLSAVNQKADLSAIGNATVTVNQGGVQKAQFTLNQKNNVTVNLDKGGDDAVWGNITGNIANQADLKTELDNRYTIIATWSE